MGTLGIRIRIRIPIPIHLLVAPSFLLLRDKTGPWDLRDMRVFSPSDPVTRLGVHLSWREVAASQVDAAVQQPVAAGW